MIREIDMSVTGLVVWCEMPINEASTVTKLRLDCGRMCVPSRAPPRLPRTLTDHTSAWIDKESNNACVSEHTPGGSRFNLSLVFLRCVGAFLNYEVL